MCGYASMHVGVRGQPVRVCSLLPWSPEVRLRLSGLMVKNLYTQTSSWPLAFLSFSFFFLSFFFSNYHQIIIFSETFKPLISSAFNILQHLGWILLLFVCFCLFCRGSQCWAGVLPLTLSHPVSFPTEVLQRCQTQPRSLCRHKPSRCFGLSSCLSHCTSA